MLLGSISKVLVMSSQQEGQFQLCDPRLHLFRDPCSLSPGLEHHLPKVYRKGDGT